MSDEEKLTMGWSAHAAYPSVQIRRCGNIVEIRNTQRRLKEEAQLGAFLNEALYQDERFEFDSRWRLTSFQAVVGEGGFSLLFIFESMKDRTIKIGPI